MASWFSSLALPPPPPPVAFKPRLGLCEDREAVNWWQPVDCVDAVILYASGREDVACLERENPAPCAALVSLHEAGKVIAWRYLSPRGRPRWAPKSPT
jgi:hypothetical protein